MSRKIVMTQQPHSVRIPSSWWLGAALAAGAGAARADDAAAAAPAAPATAAGAQSTIIITADRQPEPLLRATASVDVVTSADDRLAGHQLFVFDWLRDLAGVDVIQSGGGMAGATQLRLRGAGAAETKVLEDGIPVADPSGISGNPQIELLGLSGLERIEVVRGAQSGLYGSSAIGGVVNLISIQPTAAPRERLRVEAGSFDTTDADAQATGPVNSWLGYALGISALHSNGYAAQANPGANGNPAGLPDDSFRRLDFNGRLVAHDESGRDSAYVAFRADDSTAEIDTDGPYLPTRQHVQSWRTSAGGSAQLAEHLALAGDLAYSAIDRTYPDDASAFDDRTFDSHETYGSLRLSSDAIQHLVLTIGCDATRDAATTVLTTGEGDIDQSSTGAGIWGEARWSLSGLELSGVLRHDSFSGYGSDDTYRLGAAAFLFGERLKLFASTSTGFRAPSLYERFAQTYGNPDLESQTSSSYEIGQTTTLQPLGLSLTDTWFRTSYHRQITFDPNTFVSINLPDPSHIEGVENSLRWRSTALDIGATYTWQHSDDGTGNQLPLLPAHKISADAVLHGGSGFVRVVVERQWTRSVTYFPAPAFTQTTIEERPYTVLGAAIGYDLTPSWEVYVRGDNLANAHYEIYPLSTSEPRAFFIGASGVF
jgi:vitamin B12 transporter